MQHCLVSVMLRRGFCTLVLSLIIVTHLFQLVVHTGALLQLLKGCGEAFEAGLTLHNLYGKILIVKILETMFYDTGVMW